MFVFVWRIQRRDSSKFDPCVQIRLVLFELQYLYTYLATLRVHCPTRDKHYICFRIWIFLVSGVAAFNKWNGLQLWYSIYIITFTLDSWLCTFCGSLVYHVSCKCMIQNLLSYIFVYHLYSCTFYTNVDLLNLFRVAVVVSLPSPLMNLLRNRLSLERSQQSY